MASKSKRLRQALVAKPPPNVVPFRRQGDTRTTKTLKEKMLSIATRAQFERVIAAIHADHRQRARAILEPMLRPNLPCCAEFKVSHEHAGTCPTRRLM